MAREWEGPAGFAGGRDRTEGPYLQEALPGGHFLISPEDGGINYKKKLFL